MQGRGYYLYVRISKILQEGSLVEAMKTINEARNILNKAEKEALDPIIKQQMTDDALDMLEESSQYGLTESQVKLISNIKKSFARSLVKQIDSMNINNYDLFKLYIFTFIIRLAKEVCELCEEDSHFNTQFGLLRDKYSEDIASITK